MSTFEFDYNELVQRCIDFGTMRKVRNGSTRSLFGETLEIDCLPEGKFPLLTQRRIWYKGVFGELAAFVRGATTIGEFKKWGCNYWTPNAHAWVANRGITNEDDLAVGQIYGAQWVNWEKTGHNQLKHLITSLQRDPAGRRHVITSFSPTAFACLPPCHLLAQFYVDEIDNTLHCIVYMRSVDVILGLPSDIVLYAAMLVALASEVDMTPGILTFMMGDTHIYENHVELFEDEQAPAEQHELPDFEHHGGLKLLDFVPDDIEIQNYNFSETLRYDLNV